MAMVSADDSSLHVQKRSQLAWSEVCPPLGTLYIQQINWVHS